mgnify:CR=1 FL=1
MSPAVVALVLTLCGLRLRKLVRDERRRGMADLAANMQRAATVAFIDPDPIDWDLVAAQPTERMRAIRIDGAA